MFQLGVGRELQQGAQAVQTSWDNDRRARGDNRGGNRVRDDNRRRGKWFGSDGFDFPHMDLDHLFDSGPLFHLGGGIGGGGMEDSGDIAANGGGEIAANVEQGTRGGSSWSSSSSYSGRLCSSSSRSCGCPIVYGAAAQAGSSASS